MNITSTSIIACLSLAFVAGCATTQDTQSANLTATSEEAPATDEFAAKGAEYDEGDPDELICKKKPALTGSRIGATKDCRTREQWKRATSNGNRGINTLLNRQCNTNACSSRSEF